METSSNFIYSVNTLLNVTIQSQAKTFENADAELARADVFLNVFI